MATPYTPVVLDMASDGTVTGVDAGAWAAIAGSVSDITGSVVSAFDTGDEAQAASAARIAEAQARTAEAAAKGTLTAAISDNPLTFGALILGVVAVLAWAVKR